MPLSTDVHYTHKCADYGRDLESLIGVLMVLYYLCAHYQAATKKNLSSSIATSLIQTKYLQAP